MFYYLGRKKKIANLYPDPIYDTIIEPFAGSAAYSLHGDRWKKNVIINDLSPITFSLWKYLQSATEKDIQSLPDLNYHDKLSDYNYLSEDERWLISFHINPGANQRSNIVTKFNRWGAGKKYITENLYKIRHWTILNCEYFKLENILATWFIDPPYQRSGKYYMTNTISNYNELGNWCVSRFGQIVVCEQNGAEWLPFIPLMSVAIAGKNKTNECIYTLNNGIMSFTT